MTYKVEINPAKEKEFLQLLQAWQSLDVVKYFSLLTEDGERVAETYIPSWERVKAKNTREIGEEYRDLVD